MKITMKRIVAASLLILELQDIIIELKKRKQQLEKFQKRFLYQEKIDVSLLDEQITLLEIKKESLKQYVQIRIDYIARENYDIKLDREDFSILKKSDIKNGYVFLGKDAEYILSLDTGMIFKSSMQYGSQ